MLLLVVGYPGYTMGTEAPLPTALEEEVSLSINCLYSIFLTAALKLKFKDAQADRQQTAFVDQGSICFSPVSFVLLLFMKY